MPSVQIKSIMKDLRETLSMTKKRTLMSNHLELPVTSSSIQNKIDLIYIDLVEEKLHIEEMLQTVARAEELVNLINYRAYELRYDYYGKIDQLEDKLNTLRRNSYRTNILDPLAAVNMEDENQKLYSQFEKNDRQVREALLQAQGYHELCIDDLDTTLNRMELLYDNLKILLDSSKLGQQGTGQEHRLVADVESMLHRFTQLQKKDWHSVIQKKDKFIYKGRKLSLTSRGLLETKSGHTLTYKEVRDCDLLKGMDIFNYIQNEAIACSGDSSYFTRLGQMKSGSDESDYIKSSLGTPLTLALAEIAALKPSDPIHYLGHWLFKYRYNQEASAKHIKSMQELNLERSRIAEEKWKQMVQEEVRELIMQMIVTTEEEAYRKELEEIKRIQNEQSAEEELIDKALEEEARDKFDTYETGLTT